MTLYSQRKKKLNELLQRATQKATVRAGECLATIRTVKVPACLPSLVQTSRWRP